MPQFFKNNGYFTSSAGKIFHDGMDDPISWTYPSNQTAWIHCYPGERASIVTDSAPLASRLVCLRTRSPQHMRYLHYIHYD